MADATTTVHIGRIQATLGREADDQGVTRLAMLAFLRGEDGPWAPGNDARRDRWVRYRAHQIDRHLTLDGNQFTLTYADHTGTTVSQVFTVSTSALALLRDLDDLLDVVFEQWPHADETNNEDGVPTYTTAEGTVVDEVVDAGMMLDRAEQTLRRVHDLVKSGARLDDIDRTLHAWKSTKVGAAYQHERDAEQLRKMLVDAAFTHDGLHTAWVNSHDDWLRALVIEQTERFDRMRAAGTIPDRAEYQAAQAADKAEREQHERDTESEAKAAARAEEWTTEGLDDER